MSLAGASAYLFVYGTLREGAGHPMHAVIAAAGHCVGPASVAGRLYRIDWYPGLRLGEAGDKASDARVVGEVWALSDPSVFTVLDDYEAEEYERRVLPVSLPGGRRVPAWTYVFTGPVEDLEEIPSGDWLRRDAGTDAAKDPGQGS